MENNGKSWLFSNELGVPLYVGLSLKFITVRMTGNVLVLSFLVTTLVDRGCFHIAGNATQREIT